MVVETPSSLSLSTDMKQQFHSFCVPVLDENDIDELKIEKNIDSSYTDLIEENTTRSQLTAKIMTKRNDGKPENEQDSTSRQYVVAGAYARHLLKDRKQPTVTTAQCLDKFWKYCASKGDAY